MTRAVRYVLLAVCAVQFVFAIAFFRQSGWATDLWPFDGTTPMSFIFLSSIFAAAAASTLWAVLTRTYGALAGVGLDYIAILLPVSIHAWLLGQASGSQALTNYAVVCIGGALFGLLMLLWSVRIPIDERIPMPALVRWSFVIFIIVLVIVGTRLVRGTPNILPWTISKEMAVGVGWMFYGAAVYFAYSLFRPSWNNAASQLAGFLAYDIVLIGPFLQRLSTVAPEHQRGLYIYIAVVTYSAVLATYYLFVNPATRILAGVRPADANEPRLAPAR